MRFPMVRWSPDGKKLAIGYYDQEKALTDILTLDTEAMETLASGLPSDWSPDGQWLLTSGDTSNDPQVITIVNTTSGQSAFLSEGRGGVWQP
jgi:Tol biopolymer transport system component